MNEPEGTPPAPAMGWHTASVAGLLYALLMCTWKRSDEGTGFDELAIRFAIYFVVFTVGFRLLINLWLKHRWAGR